MSAGHFELLSKDVGVPLVCFRLKKVVGSDGECFIFGRATQPSSYLACSWCCHAGGASHLACTQLLWAVQACPAPIVMSCDALLVYQAQASRTTGCTMSLLSRSGCACADGCCQVPHRAGGSRHIAAVGRQCMRAANEWKLLGR